MLDSILLQDAFLQDDTGIKEIIFLFLQYFAIFCSAIQEVLDKFAESYLFKRRKKLFYSSRVHTLYPDKIKNELEKVDLALNFLYEIMSPIFGITAAILTYSVMILYIIFVFDN